MFNSVLVQYKRVTLNQVVLIHRIFTNVLMRQDLKITYSTIATKRQHHNQCRESVK